MARLAVVIPAYNEAKVVTRVLDALIAQTRQPDAVYVVNNASTDNTKEIVEKFIAKYPTVPIKLIYESQKGTGAACDTGFRAAIRDGYELIARTDADSAPEPTWLASMIRAAETHPDVQLFGGRIIPLKDEWYRSGDDLLLPVGLQMIHSGLVIVRKDLRYRRFAIGSNMMIRKSGYEGVGGFTRSSIEVIDEDIDLTARVDEIYGSKAVKIIPSAKVAVSMRRARAEGKWKTMARHIFSVRRSQSDIR